MKREFWLINTSLTQDIGVQDLGIRIGKGQRINLSTGNYLFTEEDILKSAESGSIFKKNKTLVLQEKKPQAIAHKMRFEIAETRVLKPARHSGVETVQPYYIELDIEDDILGKTDEEFAMEQADAEFMDRAPNTVGTDKKFSGK